MRCVILNIALLLAGCLSQQRTPEPALYDLGLAPAEHLTPATLNADSALLRVRVSAPSWLDQTAMHYRLLYADGMRTRTYAYARWIAPPAELVDQRLRQRLSKSGVRASALDVELEEYVQVFETPTQSFGRATFRVRTYGTSSEEASFTEQVAAQTPDAVGGARALAAATDVLIGRIVDWMSGHGEHEAVARPQVARPASY